MQLFADHLQALVDAEADALQQPHQVDQQRQFVVHLLAQACGPGTQHQFGQQDAEGEAHQQHDECLPALWTNQQQAQHRQCQRKNDAQREEHGGAGGVVPAHLFQQQAILWRQQCLLHATAVEVLTDGGQIRQPLLPPGARRGGFRRDVFDAVQRGLQRGTGLL
ncbi:hypothetical protein D3C71_1237400 [compost metagenome]